MGIRILQVCVCMNTYVYTYIHIHAYVCVCVYICIYINMCIYYFPLQVCHLFLSDLGICLFGWARPKAKC